MASTIKLQRKTERSAAKEDRLNEDVGHLRNLLREVLEMNAHGNKSGQTYQATENHHKQGDQDV